jgi:hypothetical protein
MAAQVTTGLEIITHLDEDWAVPCGRNLHKGDEPAEWIAWAVKCCERMRPYVLWCEPCREDAVQRMASYDRYCPHCARLFAPALTVVRLVEPLNRKAGH